MLTRVYDTFWILIPVGGGSSQEQAVKIWKVETWNFQDLFSKPLLSNGIKFEKVSYTL